MSHVGADAPEQTGTGVERRSGRMSNISCCICGTSIQPNGANMCGPCMRERVDVAEGIPQKGLVVVQCRRCLRWLTKSGHWSSFEPESAPFLAFVLKKIPGLAKQDLVDAKWVWREPHSKRLEVQLHLRKEVMDKVMLQKFVSVEFVVHNQQCGDCNKQFTNQTWRSVVQIRQKAGHKRTMILVEQQILQADAHKKCLTVETVRGGMDVYFGSKNDAAEFIHFLSSVSPVRTKESARMISSDPRNNTRNTQFTVAVDLPPLCRDDLLVLPRGAGTRLQGTLCLVSRVTSILQLVQPTTGERAELTADRYWRAPPEPLLTALSLVEFMVLDCEPAEPARGPNKEDQDRALWETVVTRVTGIGIDDDTFTVLTHVDGGRRPLEAGDSVLGYDLRGQNFNDALLEGLRGDLPDVVLVKRAPPPKASHSKKKRYKIRSSESNAAIDDDLETSTLVKNGEKADREAQVKDADADEIAALLEELDTDDLNEGIPAVRRGFVDGCTEEGDDGVWDIN